MAASASPMTGNTALAGITINVKKLKYVLVTVVVTSLIATTFFKDRPASMNYTREKKPQQPGYLNIRHHVRTNRSEGKPQTSGKRRGDLVKLVERCLPHRLLVTRGRGLPGPCDDSHVVLPCGDPYRGYLEDPRVLAMCGVGGNRGPGVGGNRGPGVGGNRGPGVGGNRGPGVGGNRGPGLGGNRGPGVGGNRGPGVGGNRGPEVGGNRGSAAPSGQILVKRRGHSSEDCGDRRGRLVSDPLLPVTPLEDAPPDGLVPNIVHYVSLGCDRMFTFANYISVLSVRKFVSPDRIFFHGDCLPKGSWWNQTVRTVPNIFFRQRMRTKYIQGRPPMYPEHETDIIRIQVMLDEGGIYLDSDVIIVAPLTDFRRYTVTQGRQIPGDKHTPGSAFFLAQPRSAFVCLWLFSFREYASRNKTWSGFAIHEPGNITVHHPELVHQEKAASFFKPNFWDLKNMYAGFYDWSENYVIHLWNHLAKKKYKLPQHPSDIQELSNIKSTIHEVFRYIYFGDKIIHAKKKGKE